MGRLSLKIQHFSLDDIYKTTTEAFITIEQLLKKGSFTYCLLNVYKAEAEGGHSIKKRTFE